MLPIDKLPKGYWATADGRLMEFSEINPSHLLNIERMLRGEGGSTATHLNVEQRVKALKSARKEIRKRGLTPRPSLRDESVFDVHHFRFLVGEFAKFDTATMRARTAIEAMNYITPRLGIAFKTPLSLVDCGEPTVANEFREI